MRCNEVQLNYVNWTVWHDLFTYAQNYFQCWTFQYVFSYWSKIDFFSGHSKLLFMYISIQLKIPIMIKLFLVIQWKRTGKYLDNGNRMTKYPFAVIIIPKRDKEQRQMNYEECIELARPRIGKYCKACKECNGKACGNQIPGPGAKGIGDTAIRNYDKWKEIRVNMDTIAENGPVNTSLELFGKKFRYPFFAGPVGAVNLHYGDCLNDISYNDILVSSCAEFGIAAFTGDGMDGNVMVAATQAIHKAKGLGIPTVKPWNMETIRKKMELVHASEAFAVAMDVDAAGLPFLKNFEPPAGSKTVEELHEVAKEAGAPFIVKGVMTVKGALKAKEAGADAIVVSNHGGRVLDQCPATAEVLADIAKAVDGSMKIFVDGVIRSGTDVFKALALGADAAIIARPFVTAVYGGGREGVEAYISKIGGELEDTMKMCGVSDLAEITEECIWKN